MRRIHTLLRQVNYANLILAKICILFLLICVVRNNMKTNSD